MKKKRNSVIIVGAGPIGCYLAQLLRKQGMNSVLIEEHKELGKPVHCAGLVGRKVFEEAKISLFPPCVLNTINGAVIHVGREKLMIRRKKVAYVIDREKFDKHLGKGLHIRYGSRFLGLETHDSGYIVETDRGDLETEIVVGADGVRSLVRESLKMNGKVSYLKGVQFRIKVQPDYKDMVEVYWEKPYFYWIIPESEKIIRVGVISNNPYHNLLAFIKKHKLKGKVLEKFGGFVPLTHFMPLSFERVFLVGDSAVQVKPLTYGGIYTGMKGAEILAECISNENFSGYTSQWTERFGKEIGISVKARHILSKLSEQDLKKIFSFVKRNIDIIEEKGDFENHSFLVWEFLKRPDISREMLGVLLKIVRASFTNEPNGNLTK